MTISLVYMANPIYGGWVTFSAHLSLRYNCDLYKIKKRSESRKRDYGYGVFYQNQTIEDALQKDNIVITAVDKHHWQYLDKFPSKTKIVIHDPTELNGKGNVLRDLIHKFDIYVIRETMKTFLKKEYNVDCQFLIHPFYPYPKKDILSKGMNDFYSLSISRIDFDKHTDLLLDANLLIEDPNKKIQIFGAENRLYVFHKLKDKGFDKYWKGKYPKTLPMQYEDKDLLTNCRFVVDMSIIKGDGGGTQYTFLEAIYHDCALILHKEWVSKGNVFKDRYNCYVVGHTDDIGKEIADIINSPIDETYNNIVKNSQILLDKHINVKWF